MENGILDSEFITAEDYYRKSQFEYILKKIDSFPTEIIISPFTDWAEENRYIPEGISDYYGQFDRDFAPHLNEILERMHPDDPCTNVDVMKSTQSLVTTTVAENTVGAVIEHGLGSLAYFTSTKKIAEIRGSANIDSLIDNSNLADKLQPISNRTSRKSKDNTSYKEFKINNQLLLSSYGSIAEAKSNPFAYLILDELDEAGKEIKDQGDTEDIIDARTYAKIDHKTLTITTPTRMETSRGWKNWLRGDQRRFHGPCPECGDKQTLTLKRENEKFGLTFTTETDKETGNKILIPETIRYICKFCHKEFYEDKKMFFLKNGVWIPDVKNPVNKLRHSYHIPGVLSPALKWERYIQTFIGTNFGQDIPKFKNFVITMDGWPWAAVKKAVEWEILKARAEDYIMGEVPEGSLSRIDGFTVFTGPLLLYGGVDVQGDRLELCVTGFGHNGEKWIVDYRIFYGKTENLDDSCWSSLDDFVKNHPYKICEKNVFIGMTAVDSGYDPRKVKGKREKDYNGKAHIVYEFVSRRSERFVAIMGTPDDKAIGILKESRISDLKTTLTKRYMVAVSLLKESIMNVIENNSGFNTIHVPKFLMVEGQLSEVPDSWFKQFLSERWQEDPKNPGSFIWYQFRARNEVLDTFIYSIAAAETQNISSWSPEYWSSYYYNLIAA